MGGDGGVPAKKVSQGQLVLSHFRVEKTMDEGDCATSLNDIYFGQWFKRNQPSGFARMPAVEAGAVHKSQRQTISVTLDACCLLFLFWLTPKGVCCPCTPAAFVCPIHRGVERQRNDQPFRR